MSVENMCASGSVSKSERLSGNSHVCDSMMRRFFFFCYCGLVVSVFTGVLFTIVLTHRKQTNKDTCSERMSFRLLTVQLFSQIII